jgi:hypothetical protein
MEQHSGSWLERVLDRIAPPPPAPASPARPPVDQTAWEQSVDHHKVNTLTVHDVGLIVFNETRSFSDSDRANEAIDAAREKVAHVVINGDERSGRGRPVTASAIEPSAETLLNPKERLAYDSSMAAARNAYLSADDPTYGATHFRFLTAADRSNWRFPRGTPGGVPIRTQSGPFNNSYVSSAPGGVPSHTVYVNTYGSD